MAILWTTRSVRRTVVKSGLAAARGLRWRRTRPLGTRKRPANNPIIAEHTLATRAGVCFRPLDEAPPRPPPLPLSDPPSRRRNRPQPAPLHHHPPRRPNVEPQRAAASPRRRDHL